MDVDQAVRCRIGQGVEFAIVQLAVTEDQRQLLGLVEGGVLEQVGQGLFAQQLGLLRAAQDGCGARGRGRHSSPGVTVSGKAGGLSGDAKSGGVTPYG